MTEEALWCRRPPEEGPWRRREADTDAPVLLTLLPRIWLMAALSFSVHSATTLARISFIYSMKAFRGFLM